MVLKRWQWIEQHEERKKTLYDSSNLDKRRKENSRQTRSRLKHCRIRKDMRWPSWQQVKTVAGKGKGKRGFV